jgi:polysaccharide export outer membrane protein
MRTILHSGRIAPLLLAGALAWAQPKLSVRDQPYTLGPDDQIVVRALHADEISDKPLRIEADGYITLPLVGRIRAEGLTSSQLQNVIADKLKVLIEEPEVSVSLVEQQSQPVSVLGAVKNPGVHQLHGPKSVIEVLSIAGGVEADAGYAVRISRRSDQGPLPVPNAKPDMSGDFSVAELSLEEVMDGRQAAGNVIVRPHDVITVPRAKMVYAIGEVKKPGGFVLREKESVSVLQVLSLAEGLNHTAGPGSARVLRPNPEGGERKEIPVNLNEILSGKRPDVMLQPDDILFVPNSMAKSATLRTIEAAIQLGTGIVIWRK